MLYLKWTALISLLTVQNYSLGLVSKVNASKPKLVLILSVDQFRADYLMRFKDRFLPAKSGKKVGGYQFLMENGAYYPFAQYDILQSMTGPGHATLLSGSYPYNSGVPLNGWYDREKKRGLYCVEDDRYEWIGTQTKSQYAGTSPKSFIGSTVGDELKNSGYKSKVVTIALKDRSAIYMGGHRADAAFWFDDKEFKWISSNYYFPDKNLPKFVADFNQKVGARKGQQVTWSPRLKKTMEDFFDQTKTYPENKILSKIGTQFDHGLMACSPEELTGPYGIELTTKFAMETFDYYQLGKNVFPDLLAISLSSHDYVGHVFGANSKEIEDMTLAEDYFLSELFNKLNQSIEGGLKNVLIVLSADHGVVNNIEWLKEKKVPAGKIKVSELKNKIEKTLVEKLGRLGAENYILDIYEMNIYLNRDLIKEQKKDIELVEKICKEVLVQEEGVAYAFSKTDYEKRTLPPGMFERQILKTYRVDRSGDVIGILKPFFIESDKNVVTHMTSYSYDKTVPLILFGAQFKAGMIPRIVEVVDIAPTLSYILGITPPAASEGRILTEAFLPTSIHY